MRFEPELIRGVLIRRYKRFLADVTLDCGRQVTAHCPNTGAMLGCRDPGLRVWLSESDNPRRKYRHTWELVETAESVLVGIHTGRSNAIVEEAIRQGCLREFPPGTAVRREVSFPGHSSRFDFLLTPPRGKPWILEVKNVTAAVQRGTALFPDAKSQRASRHVQELQQLAGQGYRSMMLFCVQRQDANIVMPYDQVDPGYGKALREAAAGGVEVQAWGCEVDPGGVSLKRRLPVLL